MKFNLDHIESCLKYGSKTNKKKTCPACDGKGTYLEEGDAHRSTGWVPCRRCGKTGYIE